MSTGTSTGFCRITIAAPDSRVDVALPEDLPIQDLFPEIVRLSGLVQSDNSLAGYHLVIRHIEIYMHAPIEEAQPARMRISVFTSERARSEIPEMLEEAPWVV